MSLLKGPRAIEAGIRYIQDSLYEFQAKENGRVWSVYGSPVRSMFIFGGSSLTNVHPVVSSIWRMGIQLPSY